MSHKSIVIDNISLEINNKIGFKDFTAQILNNKRIAIMGFNGTGKSSLLKILQGLIEPTTGRVYIPDGISFGYVPQTVTEYQNLSGGQRFNKSLSVALSLDPDVLCLDEPTNHLDQKNKQSLIRMLRNYIGTLLVVSHDPDLLALDFDEIWHIENEKINVFKGSYSDYLKEYETEQKLIYDQREQSKKKLRELTKAVQREQKIAAQSRAANKDEKDRALLGAMKDSGSRSLGQKSKQLSKAQSQTHKQLADTFIHKKIKPKFNLDSKDVSLGKSIIFIQDGSCGYGDPILDEINLHVLSGERIAITGNNGTGKSTLLRALLHYPDIQIAGKWKIPSQDTIGYLDQHYSTLDTNKSALEIIKQAAPHWTDLEIRKHLNDFLFRGEVVENIVANLSGGEKARLSLAQIAAKNPQLLLLDEITNNIDVDTRQHIIEVLQEYPGTILVVSHDAQFLKELSLSSCYETKDGKLVSISNQWEGELL